MSGYSFVSNPTRQYTLRNTLQNDMLRLFESREGCDILFVIEGTQAQIPAHSSIIAVRCKLLVSQLNEFLAKRRKGPQEQPDFLRISVGAVTTQTFMKVLRYVYSGTISLDASDVYEVCTLSAFLGVAGLQDIVFTHLRDAENTHLTATVLDQALQHSERNHALIARLTQHLSQNCAKILRHAPFPLLSRSLIMHIIKQEDLWASELEIWQACIAWSSEQCGIKPYKKVSAMTEVERRRVSAYMKEFCRPGLIRILNFDTTAFANEVEPLALFHSSEVLLKYRFDATAGLAPFDQAFPLDRYSFLTRIRQRTMCFESSSHPHPRGVCNVVKVTLPIWVSQVRVVFDPRTALGRYADLEFFADEERSQRIFSLRASGQCSSSAVRQTISVGRNQSDGDNIEPLLISGRVFWFTFYAPQNVGGIAGWGYKFLVSIVR